MSDDEYFSDDDDLVPIDDIPEFTIEKKQTPTQFLQQIQQKIQKEKQKEKIEKYQWDNLGEKALKKMKQYTDNNEIQAKLFFSIINATLDQTFKNIMGIEKTHLKLKRKKKTELQERQKNFLFNCIRKQFKEETQPYEHDKKLYFSTLTTIFNNKGETLNITDEESINLYKCQQCIEKPDLIIDFQKAKQTCPECGTEETLNPRLREFIAFSNMDQFSTGTKDVSKDILGFQLFIGGPMGFEFTKENIAKRMRDYLNTVGPFWTDEKIENTINTFKREANAMKRKNEALKNQELKEKALKLIKDQNIEFYNKNPNELLNLMRELKLDISTTIEENEENKEEELQRLNNAILKFNTGYFDDIKNIEKFEEIKKVLITNQIKGLSEPIVIKRTILTKPQMAAIFWKIKKQQEKTTQQEVADKFSIKPREITEFINTLQNPKEPMDRIFVKKIKRNPTVKKILLQ